MRHQGDIFGLRDKLPPNYQSNHSKVEAILLNALSKQGPTNGFFGLSSGFLASIPLMLNVKQLEKLWIPTFYVFWSDSTRESSPGPASAKFLCAYIPWKVSGSIITTHPGLSIISRAL